jgi:hypothetical protein
MGTLKNSGASGNVGEKNQAHGGEKMLNPTAEKPIERVSGVS